MIAFSSNINSLPASFSCLISYQKYGSRDDIKYLNYAGRVTYSYNQKYIGEFAASYTGCDDYAPKKIWILFPAFSAGWILSKENFMKNINC